MEEHVEDQMEEQQYDYNAISKICKPMAKVSQWMNLIALVLILIGILLIFTIYGIVICWIPIWMGVVLAQSTSIFKVASFQNNKDTAIAAMKKLSTFFTISGIVFLVGLVFSISTFIMILVGAVSAGGIFRVLKSMMFSLF